MIRHFLLRDFLSHRLLWVLICLGTVGTAIAQSLTAIEIYHFTAYFYFLFWLVPFSSLVGVRLRSQQALSRYYLLALPVERKKQFLLLQLRSFVFSIPLCLYLFITPLFSEKFGKVFFMARESYWLYSISMALFLISMTNSSFLMQLRGEQISSYLKLEKRMLAWIRTLGILIAEGGAFILCLVTPGLWEVHIALPLFLLGGLALWQFFSARKAWIGVQNR